MQAYTIYIKNETHTIGNLLQTYISDLYNDRINFVGYKNPHPLLNIIEIKISSKIHTLDEINDIVNGTCDQLIIILDTFKNYIDKQFNLQKSISIKPKKSTK
jgi:DNA-directed RNA polymerase subunit L